MNLTPEQKKLILLIGGPDDTGNEITKMETHQELVSLGLVYLRDDGQWDLTDEGERIYDELPGSSREW